MTAARRHEAPSRSRSHQLAFELVPTGFLAAATRQWVYVAVLGALLLPAVRGTWVGWIRTASARIRR